MPIFSNVSGAIVTGGKSSRFGQDKASALLGHKRMVVHVAEKLEGLFSELLIVGKKELLLPHTKFVVDITEEQGSIVGLVTALKAARFQHVFITACDMPFLNRDVVSSIVKRRHKAQVIIPEFRGKFQPFCAIYAKKILPLFQDAMRRGRYSIYAMIPKLDISALSSEEILNVDPSGTCFFNINTKEDWQEAQKFLKKS